jgi:hypothetical protein
VRIVKVYIIICVCVWCVMDLMMNVYRVMMMRKDFKPRESGEKGQILSCCCCCWIVCLRFVVESIRFVVDCIRFVASRRVCDV